MGCFSSKNEDEDGKRLDDLEKGLFQGWGEKLAKNTNKLYRRWFSLEILKATLTYSEDQGSQPDGIISLVNADVKMLKKDHEKYRPYSFSILTPKREHLIVTHSPQAMKKWVMLSSHLDQKKFHKIDKDIKSLYLRACALIRFRASVVAPLQDLNRQSTVDESTTELFSAVFNYRSLSKCAMIIKQVIYRNICNVVTILRKKDNTTLHHTLEAIQADFKNQNMVYNMTRLRSSVVGDYDEPKRIGSVSRSKQTEVIKPSGESMKTEAVKEFEKSVIQRLQAVQDGKDGLGPRIQAWKQILLDLGLLQTREKVFQSLGMNIADTFWKIASQFWCEEIKTYLRIPDEQATQDLLLMTGWCHAFKKGCADLGKDQVTLGLKVARPETKEANGHSGDNVVTGPLSDAAEVLVKAWGVRYLKYLNGVVDRCFEQMGAEYNPQGMRDLLGILDRQNKDVVRPLGIKGASTVAIMRVYFDTLLYYQTKIRSYISEQELTPGSLRAVHSHLKEGCMEAVRDIEKALRLDKVSKKGFVHTSVRAMENEVREGFVSLIHHLNVINPSADSFLS